MKLTFVEDKEYDSQFAESLEEREGLDIAYDRDVEPIARAIEGYQKSWDSINDDFSRYVEDVTGHPWAHEEYECVVSPVHQGISNWNGSKRIVRWCKDDPLKMRHITAHEL
ncbi:hypothetical protein HQ524_03150, partial [Candidatus Uhrbacteria bacterium]|nr:hypothetical protein [Candidatus Uhrbacteria bacterium]